MPQSKIGQRHFVFRPGGRTLCDAFRRKLEAQRVQFGARKQAHSVAITAPAVRRTRTLSLLSLSLSLSLSPCSLFFRSSLILSLSITHTHTYHARARTHVQTDKQSAQLGSSDSNATKSHKTKQMIKESHRRTGASRAGDSSAAGKNGGKCDKEKTATH